MTSWSARPGSDRAGRFPVLSYCHHRNGMVSVECFLISQIYVYVTIYWTTFPLKQKIHNTDQNFQNKSYLYPLPRWSCEAVSLWQEPIRRDVRRMRFFFRLWLMGQSWVTSSICVLPSKPSRPGWQEEVLSLNPVIATGKESIDSMKGVREH